MRDLIELLGKSNSPALLALVVGAVMILFFREYFKAVIRLRELRQKREEIQTEKSFEIGRAAASNKGTELPVERETSGAVVDFNFRLLEKYYEQHLVEYKLMARASLVIAVLGFLVIVIGVSFTFANQVSVGVITSIAGLVSEAAAVLFFKQNNLLIEQIREYHKKLVSTQYLLTSISLASELPEEEAVFERKRIIGNLLFLSNELHGAASLHLFAGQAQNELPSSNAARSTQESNSPLKPTPVGAA